MCDICVMNQIKDKMLSRRQLLGRGAMAAAAAPLALSAGPSWAEAAKGAVTAKAATGGRILDMTHTLSPDFPTYFGEPQFAMKSRFNYAEHKFNLFELSVNEHTGTHIDAPLHFSKDGASVDQIPVERLIAPLCVIDIAARAAQNPDAQVTPDDVKAWIAKHGDIPEGACVAMHSGWGAKAATKGFRNFDGKAQHYPGFHVEAAHMLIERTKAASIAVDTLSLDTGSSADFATHYAWLPTGRFGIECLANLDQAPAAGAMLFIGAPKHAGGTGGPARIFAMI